MKIWTVTQYDPYNSDGECSCRCRYIIGVYSTEELAKKAAKKGYYPENSDIECHEVDHEPF